MDAWSNMCTYNFVYVYANMHAYVYVHVYVYMYVYVCMCAETYENLSRATLESKNGLRH